MAQADWQEVSPDVWEKNLANVIILNVAYYEGYGWRGVVKAAYDFPMGITSQDKEDAMKLLNVSANRMLLVALTKLG